MEQLVRHFLIETGPKGVKIKGCPSEPYFGEQHGPRRFQWVGFGRTKGSQEGERRAGDLWRHRRTPLTSPCRQPVRPGVPALHLPAVPALLPAHSQQRWVSRGQSSHFPSPAAAQGSTLQALAPSLPFGGTSKEFSSPLGMRLPVDLPCWPSFPSDPLEETPEAPVPANMSTAADLLRQGAGRDLPSLLPSP